MENCNCSLGIILNKPEFFGDFPIRVSLFWQFLCAVFSANVQDRPSIVFAHASNHDKIVSYKKDIISVFDR